MDFHIGSNEGAPDVGGVLEGDESLLAEGGSCIAARRCDRGRIIEAFAWCIGVVNDNDGSGARGGAWVDRDGGLIIFG